MLMTGREIDLLVRQCCLSNAYFYPVVSRISSIQIVLLFYYFKSVCYFMAPQREFDVPVYLVCMFVWVRSTLNGFYIPVCGFLNK